MQIGLILLCAAGMCLQAAQAAVPPTIVEPFGDDYETDHIVLLSVSFAVAGALLVTILCLFAWKRTVPLAHILLAMVFAAVIVSGMVSWIITYEKMRDETQEKVLSLILLSGNDVEGSVLRKLDAGTALVSVYKQLHRNGIASVNDTFPKPLEVLHALRRGLHQSDESVAMIYYGNEWGYTFGVRPANVNGSTTTRSTYGFPRSAPLSQISDFRCIGRDLASAGCDTVDCSTADSVHCAATCEIANSTNCYGEGDDLSILYYEPDWGTYVPASDEAVRVDFTYDPRQRPWYKAALNSDQPIWTAPYAWTGEVGFTQAVAIVEPTTGARPGVLGIDYHLAHMYGALVQARPTPNSEVYLCSLDGYLYAASRLSKEVIRTTWDSARGRTRYHLDNVLVHHNPAVNKVFNSIVGRVGSLNEASQVRRLLQMPDSTLLVSPLNVTGGLNMIVVIEVPHRDILNAVNDASTLSLGFVIVFSVVLAGLVSGAIYLLVSSIEAVSRDMHDVAWMRVGSTQVAAGGSVVREIRSMQDSFHLLVCNMIEYRQYLPQSLLTDSISKECGDDVEESVKVCLHTQPHLRTPRHLSPGFCLIHLCRQRGSLPQRTRIFGQGPQEQQPGAPPRGEAPGHLRQRPGRRPRVSGELQLAWDARTPGGGPDRQSLPRLYRKIQFVSGERGACREADAGCRRQRQRRPCVCHVQRGDTRGYARPQGRRLRSPCEG